MIKFDTHMNVPETLELIHLGSQLIVMFHIIMVINFYLNLQKLGTNPSGLPFDCLVSD